MRHANFKIVDETQTQVVIKDCGPWSQHPTITNDAEWVVEQLACRLRGRLLLYFDSDGRLDQLLVNEGRFAGFAPAP